MKAIENKTMNPKHAPRCRVCKGAGKKKTLSRKGVEIELDCPACGGTGKGKLATK